MLTAIIQSAAAGWLWRRARELGSLATIFVPIYLAMPQSMKDDVHAIFTGQGGGLTISAAIGLGWYIWTQLQSYRATTKAQVVTSGGKKLPLSRSGSEEAEAIAKLRQPPRTLWERLTGK
ncbi:hypothetical protein [Devosia sp. 2618]|uniref:hypothetical protein n=1 Tax=Devosia sp. 2618 TaxID=3156454 RepID=UPI00339A1095